MTGHPKAQTSQPPAVLLVDDDPQFLDSAGLALRAAGVEPVLTVEDGRKVLPLLAKRDVSALVLDLTMPNLSGEELLKMVREEFPHIHVIVMTGRDEVETAVSCMREGAFDYLVKPVESSRFVASVNRAREMRELQEEVSSLKTHLLESSWEHPEAFSGIVTNSREMLGIFHYLEAIARSTQPVLITGETGVGKELIARGIHTMSAPRRAFVGVNVAGLDDTMFSDTLFGHTKGAFTGAEQAREGLIAQASGGTLFLDEIGDLKDSSQVKLLRLLEEKEYYPLGSDVSRRADARVICATHKNPTEMLSAKTLRKDLYYRLTGHHVHVPPLRGRPEDLPLLVGRFLEEAARSLGKKRPTPPPELFTLLSAYDFPGNVRELKMMIHDAVARHRSGVLSLESFRKTIGPAGHPQRRRVPAGDGSDASLSISGRFPTLKEAEEFLVKEALKRSRDNQGIAATLLGISRQALNKRLIRDPRKPKPAS
jgi:DNA-binding NtrC family response regulator